MLKFPQIFYGFQHSLTALLRLPNVGPQVDRVPNTFYSLLLREYLRLHLSVLAGTATNDSCANDTLRFNAPIWYHSWPSETSPHPNHKYGAMHSPSHTTHCHSIEFFLTWTAKFHCIVQDEHFKVFDTTWTSKITFLLKTFNISR